MRLLASASILVLVPVLTGCGSAASALGPIDPDGALRLPALPTGGPDARGVCAAEVTSELDAVARRIYAQSVSGRNLTASMRRLTTSPVLAAAVAREDPAAVRRALPPLVRNQVVRLLVLDRHGRILVSKGKTRSFAPQPNLLRDHAGRPVGRILVAVSGDAALVGIVNRITGSDVVLTNAGGNVVAATRPGTPAPAPGARTLRLRGRRYRVSGFATQAFPTGLLRVDLLTPPLPATLCATRPAETRMNALAYVGRRLYVAEGRSPEVTRSLARARHLGLMRRAVADRSPSEFAAAVGVLFRDHRFHIVRVRAVDARGRLIGDVGGPHALAPAETYVLGPNGRLAGRVELSVQDDTGYVKLMQRFGRVGVVLHEGSRLVPGSTFHLPDDLPVTGVVAFHGARFRVRSFSGPRFPTGALRVSLLERERPAAYGDAHARRRPARR